jgi:hypothetical protein
MTAVLQRNRWIFVPVSALLGVFAVMAAWRGSARAALFSTGLYVVDVASLLVAVAIVAMARIWRRHLVAIEQVLLSMRNVGSVASWAQLMLLTTALVHQILFFAYGVAVDGPPTRSTLVAMVASRQFLNVFFGLATLGVSVLTFRLTVPYKAPSLQPSALIRKSTAVAVAAFVLLCVQVAIFRTDLDPTIKTVLVDGLTYLPSGALAMGATVWAVAVLLRVWWRLVTTKPPSPYRVPRISPF